MGLTKTDLEKRCTGLEEELMQARREIDRLKRKAAQEHGPAAFRYRDFFQALPDIVYELDAEGKFIFISNTVQELGYTPEELIGHHFSTIIHPEEVDAVSREKVLKHMKGKRTGTEKAPKLFDELRTGKRRTQNLEIRLMPKCTGEKEGEHTRCLFEYSEISAAGQYAGDVDSGQKEFLGTMGIIHDITEQKRTEQARKESEERFRAVFESAQDHIFIKDRQRRYTHMNPAMMEKLGVAQEQFAGKTDEDLFGNYPLPHVNQQLSYIAKTDAEVLKGKPVHTVFTGRIPEGNISMSSIKVPLYDQKGNVTGICGISRDITEQNDIQEALRESEEKYRSIVENTNDLIYSLDCREMKITYISPNVDEWGYGPDDIVGNSIGEFIHPDDLENVKELLENAIEKGELVAAQFRLKTREGRYVWVEERGNLIIENDPPARIVGVIRDISKQKKAQEELRESEEKYRVLVENIPAVIFRIDTEGKLVFANNMYLKAVGMTLEELVGSSPEISEGFLSKPEARKMLDAIRTVLEKEEKTGIELKAVNREGREGCFFQLAYPWYSADGTLGGVEVLGQDITELKQAQEKAQKLQKKLARSEKMEALGRLAAGVAHDLSNVLSPVVGYPEVLLSGIDRDDPLYRPLVSIRDAGEKAAAMTNDLLTIARRGVVPKEIVNLNRIAEEYINSPEHRELELLYPGIKVTGEFDPGLKNTEGASMHLTKTIMNLVSNAADAMPKGGEIVIRTENRLLDTPYKGFHTIPPGEYTVLTVKDSGIGISSEEITKVFDPFYSKKVKERTGTGLGLTVVHGTMEDHNGYIDIASRENEGTVFDLYLPVTDRPIHSKAVASIEQYTGTGTVLVVDEIKEQREIAHLMLTRLGYTVIAAGSGEEAVDMARDQKPDLMLVEMIMESGIDGMETFKQIAEILPKVKAVLTGRYTEIEILTQAEEMGITRFLKKPYTMQTLGMTVKEEMENRA